VFSKDTALQQKMTDAKPGELFIWRVSEPDESYHKHPNKETALSMARGALNGIISRLMSLIASTPSTVSLRLVITTDHGRLLAESRRTREVPLGMRSHQRAALGKADLQFPAEGFVINDDIAYLHGERFGLLQDCAIVLSGETFRKQDGKSGLEAFPHGGIYPEEVLVPWWVIARDIKLLPIGAEISGRGVSGRIGRLQVTINNPNPVFVETSDLYVSWQDESFSLRKSLAPVSSELVELSITWPTHKQVVDATARLTYKLPSGEVLQTDVSIAVESEEMYMQDNPLEDLL
jgi:hypothetical protein